MIFDKVADKNKLTPFYGQRCRTKMKQEGNNVRRDENRQMKS